MHYPLIHQSNQRPYHFIHGYPLYLEDQLGLRIPVTKFHGDIHLTDDEKQRPAVCDELNIPERFWIIVAGGKFDFTTKWWNPQSYQSVVDHFRDRIHFVQCGEKDHWHPRLKGATCAVGKTGLRDFIRLMHHAEGVVCPVTFAMHLAAAVETNSGSKSIRPCIVIAGGREPAHWEAYTHHQYISTNGTLSCCQIGGCWKSRCQLVGDGDPKDRRDLCENPVTVAPNLRIPQCMDMITPADVVRRIDYYLTESNGTATTKMQTDTQQPTVRQKSQGNGKPKPATRVLLEFRHGLGDAVQLTVVLKHLRHYHLDWQVEVAALIGKHSAYRGLCANIVVLDQDRCDHSRFHRVFQLDWDEARSGEPNCPSTKATRCLREVFGLDPVPDLCTYTINVSDDARQRAQEYLSNICGDKQVETGRFRAVLIHYEGNTSGSKKNLSHELVEELCNVITAAGHVPIILDWDNRSPLIGKPGIHNPGADHPLWGNIGTGDAEILAALTELSSLMIGVDSGPLHVAGATDTPTIGVWTHHHPVHFFDLADNVVYLVPNGHPKLAYGKAAVDYFRKNYDFHVYKDPCVDLPALVESRLTGAEFDKLKNKRFLRTLNSRGFTRAYYEEHRAAGLDYLGFGDWQRNYGRWLAESLHLKGKHVLDVGCACGSILRGFG